MPYYVSGGTLNPTHHSLTHSLVALYKSYTRAFTCIVGRKQLKQLYLLVANVSGASIQHCIAYISFLILGGVFQRKLKNDSLCVQWTGHCS